MVIRPLHAFERPLYARHLKRLPEADRRCRFASAGIDDAWIDAHVAAIPPDDLILGAFGRDGLAGAAHLAIRDGVAEVGISVDPDHRAEGVGSDLLAQAVAVARNRRAGRLYTLCLSENRKMVDLARRSGLTVRHEDGEAQAHLDLPPPDPLTLSREVAAGLFAVFHDWAEIADAYRDLLARAMPLAGLDGRVWPLDPPARESVAPPVPPAL